MGLLYLGQDMGVSVWAGSIWVRIELWRYGLDVSSSRYGYVDIGCLYLRQDMIVSVWADCM
jgi:hypothetical protein